MNCRVVSKHIHFTHAYMQYSIFVHFNAINYCRYCIIRVCMLAVWCKCKYYNATEYKNRMHTFCASACFAHRVVFFLFCFSYYQVQSFCIFFIFLFYRAIAAATRCTYVYIHNYFIFTFFVGAGFFFNKAHRLIQKCISTILLFCKRTQIKY